MPKEKDGKMNNKRNMYNIYNNEEISTKKAADTAIEASPDIDNDTDDEFILHEPIANSRQKKRSPGKYGLIFIAVVYFAVVLLNIFQPNRPTVSERENRQLAAMPNFSVSSLMDGSYYDGMSLFFSDTFIFREQFVAISQKMDNLLGISGDISILSGNENMGESEPDENTQNKLDEFLGGSDTENNVEDTDGIPKPAKPSEPDSPTHSIEEPPLPPVVLTVSSQSLSLPVGSTATVGFAISGGDGTEVPGISVDSECASAVIEGGNVIISGASEGTATVTLTARDVSASFTVTVTAVTVAEKDEGADFLPSGMFIYDGAVYSVSGYGKVSVGYLSQCMDYYKELFPNTRISLLPGPVSSVVIDDPEITSNYGSQKGVLDSMQSRFSAGINFVNPYDAIFSHRDEYLYFKSDHHWTQLGAYYAYTAFAESVGLTPVPLSSMEKIVINDSYNGSMYNYTGDARVKSFIDQIDAYLPTKSATMTVTRRDGKTLTYDRLIVPEIGSYLSFIAGDHPYTVINVPENPQDKSILVMKDSYGNAFIPFLAEHYGNIIVVDPRYCDINVYEQFKDYGLTDILFINNVQSQNSIKWSKYFFGCVGFDLNA